METKEITAFNPWDGLVAFQGAVLEGYRLSDKSEFFPQIWQGVFQMTLVKPEPEQEKPVKVEEVKEPPKPDPVVVELLEKLGEEQIGAAPVPPPPPKRGRPSTK